jgi:hypothetical protein
MHSMLQLLLHCERYPAVSECNTTNRKTVCERRHAMYMYEEAHRTSPESNTLVPRPGKNVVKVSRLLC